MRALLFLAVFALATQVHMSEVTEFYRTFINNIPMDVQSKNRIMNDGLDCINQAVNTIAASVQNIEHDVQTQDVVHTLRDVISSIQALENTVLPKCAQTYMELVSYLQENRNRNISASLNSWQKYELFDARMRQLIAKTIVDVLNKQPSAAAKDLAIFVSTAAGIMDPQLPAILEFDWDKLVRSNETTGIPQFLKGFFNGLGIYDNAKINATSKCALDLFSTMKTIAESRSLERGDFYTRANAFLDAAMKMTDSVERCRNLTMVDTDIPQRLIQLFKHYPAQSIITVLANSVLEGPSIRAAEINMSVLASQAQFELVGKLFAQKIRTLYNGLIF